MRYSDDLIEEIRQKNDIVDVIGGYVKLQRKGSSYFGLCPFHNEKSPSFSVSPLKQMYYCFGCGAGGNVFTFIMEYENYTFLEALKMLAERAGVELPELEYSKEAKEQADKKSQLLQINKEAAKYYYVQLRGQQGRQALDYLKGLGYGDGLLRESGLFNADERHGMYDKFWNRVIYPIMDVNNKVIGFGGRVMGDGKPKYLNSPETMIFDKSRNLYGLNAARTSRKKNLIICEGYMDVISMHQAGFNNAVASLGTALTSLQAGLMKRYTDEVLIIYDSDEAGTKAAIRAIPMLKGVGLATKVVNLKPYKDPDEFIQNEGQEACEKRLLEAENSFLFEVRISERDYDMTDPQGKTDFFHNVAGKLLSFEDEIERNNYTESVARKYQIEGSTLQKLVNKLALKGVGITEVKRPKSGIQSNREKESGIDKAQKLMLTWITSYPGIMEHITAYISPEDFTNELYRKVADMIYEQYRQGEINPAKLLNQFVDSEEQKAVTALFNASIPLETDEERRKALNDVICNMKEHSIAYRTAHLNPTDMKGLQELMQDKKALESWKESGVPLHISFD